MVGDAHKREIERSADIMNVLRERREVEDMRIKEYMKCKEPIISIPYQASPNSIVAWKLSRLTYYDDDDDDQY